MKTLLIPACLLCFGITASACALSEPTGQQIETARTAEQYRALAASCQARQAAYLHKMDQEKAEWVRRAQTTVSLAAKYPRPADSARNLYEYYALKAQEAGTLSGKYQQLAATANR